MKKKLLFVFLLPMLSQATACSMLKIESWERGYLANPVMVRDTNAHHTALEQHTDRSKEGTQGGYGIGAGGCGCN